MREVLIRLVIGSIGAAIILGVFYILSIIDIHVPGFSMGWFSCLGFIGGILLVEFWDDKTSDY